MGLHCSHNQFQVVTEPKEWPEGIRRASINSFGFGGTNSHAILEVAHPPQKIVNGYAEHSLPDWVEVVANGIHGSTEAKQPSLFCWSAYDEKGITRLCERYARYVSSIESHYTSTDEDQTLSDDLWYTLAHRGSTLRWKSWCLASTMDELHQKLTNGISRPLQSSKSPQIAFVFTGQGAQWHAMGRELWTYEVYRKSVQQADACLTSAGCSWSVISMFSPPPLCNLCIPSNRSMDQTSSIAMWVPQSSTKLSSVSLCALSSKLLL